MPWLVKDEKDASKNLLFIHVPRCGGTSLSHQFQLEQKARRAFDQSFFLWKWYHKIGMVYFFYRVSCGPGQCWPSRVWCD